MAYMYILSLETNLHCLKEADSSFHHFSNTYNLTYE